VYFCTSESAEWSGSSRRPSFAKNCGIFCIELIHPPHILHQSTFDPFGEPDGNRVASLLIELCPEIRFDG